VSSVSNDIFGGRRRTFQKGDMTTNRVRVWGDVYSGNCFKVKLLLEQLQLPYEWIHVNILDKQSRTPEFLAMNPNGRIPLLQTVEGAYLPESNAILHYLAEGSLLLPAGRLLHAQVLQWMFFEQYSHEPYVATARYIVRYLGRPAAHEAVLQQKMAPGYAALDVMESHLQSRPFFVGGRYSIADIALYAYTHVADEGGFDLSRFPAIVAWLARVKSQPCHVSMDGPPLQA
jgi:glutathione S-transferase